MTALKLILAIPALCLLGTVAAQPQDPYRLQSPDRKTEVLVEAGDSLSLSILRGTRVLAAFSLLSSGSRAHRLSP